MPEEFKGLLERERRVVDVEKPDVELVKDVIEKCIGEEKAKGVGGNASV